LFSSVVNLEVSVTFYSRRLLHKCEEALLNRFAKYRSDET
jgi:hypothetical protein